MRQVLKPGQAVDFVTPDELAALIPRPEEQTRIRAGENVTLDATGAGVCTVYKCPIGHRFEVRRVFINLSTADGPLGSVNLNVATATYVAYQRSGSIIEYGAPAQGVPNVVPGVQTWGAEQGPLVANGEVFEVRAKGLTANANMTVLVEGVLTRPSTYPRGR